MLVKRLIFATRQMALWSKMAWCRENTKRSFPYPKKHKKIGLVRDSNPCSPNSQSPLPGPKIWLFHVKFMEILKYGRFRVTDEK